ncbi:MAG TPA: oligosaccharide flippase family protein [Bacteroidia bacterium]|nr:oligosaccharide flippase family protein [Bacteroidia bacterium]
MSLFKELSGATINYGLGKFVPQLIGFLLIPIYTQYLTPEDYGLVELTSSFSLFAIIIMRMALPGSVQRFYYEHNEGQELRDYVTTMYWALMVISVFNALVIFIVSYFFINYLVPGLPLFPFVLVSLITGVLATNSEIQKRLIQARKQSRYSAVLSLITALVGITIAIILVVGFEMGAEGIVYASLGGGILFFIQSQFYLRKDMGGKVSLSLLKPSFKYSMKIWPSHFVTPFGNLFARSLLAAESLSLVGLFSLASRFITPLTMLTDAFNHAYLPIYFETRKSDTAEGYKRLKEACKKTWILSLIIYIGAATAVPPLIYLLTPGTYHFAAHLIPLMSFNFLLGILTVLYAPEMYYSKKTWYVTVMAVVRFVSNVSISFFLINYWNVYAIIFAVFMENVICLGFSVYVSRKMFNFDPDLPVIFKSFFTAIPLVVVHVLLAQQNLNYFVQLALSAVAVGLFIVLLIGTGILNVKTLKSYLKIKKL